MNELVLIIGVISFPGLIATLICDKIIVHTGQWTFLKYGIYTFVFGMSSYLALQVVSLTLHHCERHLPYLILSEGFLTTWAVLSSSAKTVHYPEMVWATVFAIAVAGATAWAVNHKYLIRLAQRFGITDKFGDENLYSYFLNSPDIDWVYVRDIARNLTYQGRVQSFAEVDGMQELVLAEVTVFEYSTSDEFYNVPFVYLCKPNGTFVIEAVPKEYMGDPNHEEGHQGKPLPQPSEGRRDANTDHPDDQTRQATTAA
ncbi:MULTISPECIES: hypothetical protein [Stenotrophomonas]|uniref:hypothetical protein n=1 Tax=Stenotrophomonas sp. CFBP8994 TaxID=3096527 RepID=UPI002A6B72A6|nr:hypothetical protein [Stenotrophomonas sp. CFBP8994]MDY0981284.1 hypothetical protein [Stenotrophomonas sp. CFBP8994]